MHSLSFFMTGRDNNLNLIRAVAAFMVLFAHSYALVGLSAPYALFSKVSFGMLAVDIFFLISGLLITASFMRSLDWRVFFMARIRRIYPALIFVTLLTVFILGPYFTTLPLWEYLPDKMTIKYLTRNMSLLFGVKYHLPEVFQNNPYPLAVNGSLWTLPHELHMYLVVGIMGVLFLFLRKYSEHFYHYGFLYLGAFLLLLYFSNALFGAELNPKWRLFAFFGIGMICYVWREYVHLKISYFLGALVILGMSSCHDMAFLFLYPFALSYIILFLAYVPSGYIRKFNHLGDYSYGLYIYAFPIQQIIAALNKDVSLSSMLLLSTLMTLCLSVLSWHFIEIRFLKRSSKVTK